jgi:hypothetical protein
MLPASVGSLMEGFMRELTRIVTGVLAAAVLTLLAAMPLVAAWRTPAEQGAVPVSIKPLELMQRATDLPGQQIQDLTTVF